MTDSNQNSPGGGGGTANNRTPASSIHWDYFFFLLSLLFSKNFSMSCGIGIVVAAEIKLVERMARPVPVSSGVLIEGLGLFTPRVFR